MSPDRYDYGNHAAKIWVGIAIGAAIGVGIALSRRKRNRWDSARDIGKHMASHSGDLAETGRDILERMKTIYEESRRVMDDASELWSRGRRLVAVR